MRCLLSVAFCWMMCRLLLSACCVLLLVVCRVVLSVVCRLLCVVGWFRIRGLCAVLCVLRGVVCVWFVVRCLFVCCVLRVARWLLAVDRCGVCVVCCLRELRVASCLLFAVCWSFTVWRGVCCSLFVFVVC